MRRLVPLLLATVLLAAFPAAAQNLPEIPFDSVANPLTLPDDIYLGEIGGVAANSKGDIFVYTRTGHPTISLGTARPFAHGGSRMFRFDKTGKYVGEIGQGSYAMLFAEKVKVDPQDNIWVVDQMASTIMEFDSEGRLVMLLGRKAESERVPLNLPPPPPAGGGGGRGAGAAPGGGGAAPDAEGGGGRGRGGPPGAGGQQDVFNRPTDVAGDA